MKLFPAVKGGRWGYIDQAGIPRIDYQFSSAGRFNDGLACVRPLGERLYGYIDIRGELVIPATFSDCQAFSEGLASVVLEGKLGYIDHTGELRFRVAGCRPGQFESGLARIQLDENQLAGESFIDTTGKEVLSARDFAFSAAKLGAGLINAGPAGRLDRWGFISREGEFKIPPRFRYARPFFNGLAAVATGKTDHELSFINSMGEVEISGPFRGADIKFSEDRCAVWSSPGFGFIDRRGTLVIPHQFYYADHFSEGLVCVRRRESDEKYGYADLNGNLVIRQVFSVTKPFQDGLALVTMRFKAADDAYGYINSSGEFVWGPSR